MSHGAPHCWFGIKWGPACENDGVVRDGERWWCREHAPPEPAHLLTTPTEKGERDGR